jgi:PD-(D/E)XK nuclease superfamily protein
VQSPTSLQRLLRDPLGFVWKYGLGWGAPQEREQPLTIAADEFGKLVHELLRRAVDALEPEPGYAAASESEIEIALPGRWNGRCRPGCFGATRSITARAWP